MRYPKSVLGVGTSLATVRGPLFRLPTRRVVHPERVVPPSRIRFSELVQRVQVGRSVEVR